MKKIASIILSCFVYCSCGNTSRERQVNKENLLANDYRLFQNTVAWDLAKAVEDEDLDMIDSIVTVDCSLVNYQESVYGGTLLMLAIRNQQLSSFERLLINNADVGVHDSYNGSSAIIIACKYGGELSIEFVSKLIAHGADINDVEVGERQVGNSTRFTPLIAASVLGKLDLVKLLVEKGADINYRNEFEQTALGKAMLTDSYSVANYLLEHGADYTLPVFYRPDVDKQMFLLDILREDFFDLDSDLYKEKMRIVAFLDSKGIEYRDSPIPEYIKKKAQEKYQDDWETYLNVY